MEDCHMMTIRSILLVLFVATMCSGCVAKLSQEDQAKLDSALKAAGQAAVSAQQADDSANKATESAGRSESEAKRAEAAVKRAESAAASAEDSAAKAAKAFEMSLRK